MTSVAFKNPMIFSVNSLRWKILDILAISWVLKSLIPQMAFILLTNSKIVDTLVELNVHLTPLGEGGGGKHCLIPFFIDNWLAA